MKNIKFNLILLAILLLSPLATHAQVVVEKPTVSYTGNPRTIEIGGIKVEGIKNYEDYVLIGLSGLSVGQQISLPGDEITNAIKRYWKHGLFSNVKIEADSIVDNKLFLKIILAQRPRISDIVYSGVKKSEREDLTNKVGLIKGNQITPNIIDRTKRVVRRYFDDKGFKNADIEVLQEQDKENEDQMIVHINVDKKEKVKVNEITIVGNDVMKTNKVKALMKKTNERNKFRNFFKTKKFIDEKYLEDKERIIEKYNEWGYRDAAIVADSVSPFDDNSVNIFLQIEEGQKYYVRDINWVGNTVLMTDALNNSLQMKKGDVYNQTHMNKRLTKDDDAIGNYYYNNGYVFFSCEPVEINIDGDSIDLEMRISEGPQATISHVRILGNDRLYEHVVRRELRTKPGDLFSKTALERSYREIAQMGHFNPENINPDVKPDATNGTVDINYILESKANDQIEFSAGWGQTGVIGKIALKFTNFSMRNLFNKNARRRAFLPQGDGQTFTLSGQTNGSYYQSYNVSFLDPWFGYKRPNSLSVSFFYSKQTDVSSNYYNSAYYNNMYSNMYGYGMYGGYGYGGYGGYGGYYNNYESYYDPDKSVQLYGISLGFGKRLRWPDDYFTMSAMLTYQRYVLKDWRYFIISNGTSNNINFTVDISRNSTDNQIFPRRGSEFSLSASLTPPWSLFDGKDYEKLALNPNSPTYQDELAEKFKWVEYYKLKFHSKTFTALSSGAKCPVLMTRVDFGYLGSYNKNKRSPFETFYVGGDGMTGYSSSYATETIALRGYENGSLTPYGYEGYAYSRMSLELRYPLMLETSTSIYALGFLEAGNAWAQAKNFNPFDVKRSAGVGVRIFLPMIGMMGIDWAYGFDKVFGSDRYSRSQFHFIIGQEF
ncbi:MAG: outer membrane protein assembly factor BamA [Bacteroidaceae bacterium]|nr:outer membrane protein assembly factor BamA [Bacteroidaceae bacterium]